MSKFKAQLDVDNKKVFMNIDEYADLHTINGTKMPVIFDNYEHLDRQKRYLNNRSLYADGVFLKELLIYVRKADFGAMPAIGRTLTLDGKVYKISDVIDENGIFSISLEANKTAV